MTALAAGTDDSELTGAIAAAMVDLYTAFYDHDRTTATTYINDKIVVCVLENILTASEDILVAGGARGEVIFTPGIACELFFLDAAPLIATNWAPT